MFYTRTVCGSRTRANRVGKRCLGTATNAYRSVVGETMFTERLKIPVMVRSCLAKKFATGAALTRCYQSGNLLLRVRHTVRTIVSERGGRNVRFHMLTGTLHVSNKSRVRTNAMMNGLRKRERVALNFISLLHSSFVRGSQDHNVCFARS